MAESKGITVHEPKGKLGATKRGGHAGANLAPPLASDQLEAPGSPASEPLSTDYPFPIETKKSEPDLNKMLVGLSLIALGAIGAMVLMGWRKRYAKKQIIIPETLKGPAPGRVWNINLDPHESAMDI